MRPAWAAPPPGPRWPEVLAPTPGHIGPALLTGRQTSVRGSTYYLLLTTYYLLLTAYCLLLTTYYLLLPGLSAAEQRLRAGGALTLNLTWLGLNPNPSPNPKQVSAEHWEPLTFVLTEGERTENLYQVSSK